MADFIIGTINQGGPRVGETFSALKQNTIFLTDICSGPNFLDFDPEKLKILRGLGEMVFTLGTLVKFGGDGVRISELQPDDRSREVWRKIVSLCFEGNQDGYRAQDPPLMTLSPKTVLEAGDQVGLGYLSIFEPLDAGNYRLKHDYPICSSGPRYEKLLEDEHETR